MKTIILTANLNSFDKVKPPVEQTVETQYFCFNDRNFPPVTGLTPRLQYRIPKTHGWQLKPGYDCYVWLDGSISIHNPRALEEFIVLLQDYDIIFFKHPWRKTVREEVDHIDEYLEKGNEYITSRYKNGMHWDLYDEMGYDAPLYASTFFVYKNIPEVQEALKQWWYLGTRYYSCDQIALSYAIKDLIVYRMEGNVFRNQYTKIVSKHK